MTYSADSYAAMLLCLSLSPNHDEYAHTLTTAEYRDICERARNCALGRIGKLMNVDISGLMQLLNISEEYAYRIYILLSRTVQLSYALEAFMAKGIRIITEFDAGYPERLTKRAGLDAPPVFYMYGDDAALNLPSIGVLGISGIKTSTEVRDSLCAIAEFAHGAGYRIISGGEFGVSRVIEGYICSGDSALTAALGGGMAEYIARPEISALDGEDRFCAISLEHPDAPFTTPHSITRNKMLISLAEAVFIFNTDGKRGESDALRSHRCDWVYAWNGYPGNHPLIKKGAVSIGKLDIPMLEEMAKRWRNSRCEQLNMFDLF